VVNNKYEFRLNSDIHHLNTWQKYNFHQPPSNLSLYQKGVCSNDIKVFNNLLQSIINLSDNPKQIKSALKSYLYAHTFYCIVEYFNVKEYDKLSLISCIVTANTVCM
jgi:hypothetical protein